MSHVRTGSCVPELHVLCCSFWRFQHQIITRHQYPAENGLLLPWAVRLHLTESHSVHLLSVPVCACMHLLYVRFCVCICQWLMNVAGWRQRAMTARLQGNYFFSLRGLLIQSSQEFCWLLKSQHEGAVIITPISASQQKARKGAIGKEIKVAVSDISCLCKEKPRLLVEVWWLIV